MITEQCQLCTCYVIAKNHAVWEAVLKMSYQLSYFENFTVQFVSNPFLLFILSSAVFFFSFALGTTNFRCCLIAVSIIIRGRWRIWRWHSLSLWMLGGASHAGMSLHSRWLYEWKMSNNLVLLFSEQHFNCTFVHTWYSLYPRIQLRLGFFPVRTFQTLTMESKRIIKIVNIKMISVDSPWNQLS